MQFKLIASHQKLPKPRKEHVRLLSEHVEARLTPNGPSNPARTHIQFPGTQTLHAGPEYCGLTGSSYTTITAPNHLVGSKLYTLSQQGGNTYAVLVETVGETTSWNATKMSTAYPDKVVFASQAPFGEHNVPSFLELIVREKIQGIIALARPGSPGDYTAYSPSRVGETVSFSGTPYAVTLEAHVPHLDGAFEFNTLQIMIPGRDPHRVTQYIFNGWSNGKYPDDVQPLFMFVAYTHEHAMKQPGHVLVHCNAGIGRTGTYLALDLAYQAGFDLKQPITPESLVEKLNALRRDRPAFEHPAQRSGIAAFADIVNQLTQPPPPPGGETALAPYRQVSFKNPAVILAFLMVVVALILGATSSEA